MSSPHFSPHARRTGSRPVSTGSSFVLLLLAVAATIGGAVYATSFARRQTCEIADLHRSLAEAAQRLGVLTRDRDATVGTLAQAHGELAELPAPPTPGSPAALRNGEIRQWLGRVHHLRALFAAHSEVAIPEMAWLTDSDWLRIAKDAALDDKAGVRRAMAEVRDAAVSQFGRKATEAMARAKKAGAKLSTPADLAPFFAPPVPAAVLDRYEFVSQATALPGLVQTGGQTQPLFREKAPVDEIYDQRYSFSAAGAFVQADGPMSWEDGMWARLRAAYKAYSAANRGPLGQPALRDVLPYAQPPLDAATQARLLEAERAAPVR